MSSKKTILVFGLSVAILGSILGILAINNRLPWQVAATKDNITEVIDLGNKPENSQSDEIKPQQNFKITLQEALQIAETVVNGKAYHIERETEDGKPVIEVGIDGKEVFVDAETGEIHSIEDLRQTGDPEDIAELTEALELQKLALITIQEALQAAESFAGGLAHTVELENEDGNLVYEVIIDLQEIYVDAGNGKVLFTETVRKVNSPNNSQPTSSIQIPDTKDND